MICYIIPHTEQNSEAKKSSLFCSFLLQVSEEADGTKTVRSAREATPGRLQNQIDEAIGGHRTSSAVINGGNGMSARGTGLFSSLWNSVYIFSC